MSFCSFSNELKSASTVSIDGKFINSYLPEATGDAVKVYLYGLSVCQLGNDDLTVEKFSENIKMDVNDVLDCFRFWEELGLINIISSEPFLVKYLPVSTGKPKKYNPEKYSEFNKALQVVIPKRMITTNEYSAYFSLMEEYSIKPEALLMIVKYCVDLKGDAIGLRYILKVATDFAQKGIKTTSEIEKELSSYTLKSKEIATILSVISPNKKPDIEDTELYGKWKDEFGFLDDAILFVAKLVKAKSMQKLDKELSILYSSKKMSEKEIDEYYKTKSFMTELAYKIDRALSVYIEVCDPVVETFDSPWIDKGYDEETLLYIANDCFMKNKRSLQDMDDEIDKLYKKGLISLQSIKENDKLIHLDDDFITSLLSVAGMSRRPIEQDRQNLKVWRDWGFLDEMILEAFKTSFGKNNPISYVNTLLSIWKGEGIFTVDKIERKIPFAENEEKEDKKIKLINAKNSVLNAEKILLSNEEYVKISNEISTLKFEQSKASYQGDDEKVKSLSAQIDRLNADLENVKKKLGVSDDMLNTEFYTEKQA